MPATLPFLKRHLLPVAAAFGLAAVAAKTEIAVRIDAISLDWRTRLRAQLSPTPAPGALAVIGIDERSLREIGRWPWPHARHGDFIQLAAQANAAAARSGRLPRRARPSSRGIFYSRKKPTTRRISWIPSAKRTSRSYLAR